MSVHVHGSVSVCVLKQPYLEKWSIPEHHVTHLQNPSTLPESPPLDWGACRSILPVHKGEEYLYVKHVH